MKKKSIPLLSLVLLIILLLVIGFVFSPQKNDSVHLTQEEIDLIEDPDSTILKIYSGAFGYALGNSTLTDEPLPETSDIRKFFTPSFQDISVGYLTHDIPTGLSAFKIIHNGTCSFVNSITPEPSKMSQFFQFAHKPSLVFNLFVHVSETYCLRNTSSSHLYIYYRTSIGDYVLFRPSSYGEVETYLLPVDDFYDYQVSAWKLLNGETTTEFDLEPYRFTSGMYSHQIWLYYAVGAVVLACVGLFITLRLVLKRKKAKSKET